MLIKESVYDCTQRLEWGLEIWLTMGVSAGTVETETSRPFWTESSCTRERGSLCKSWKISGGDDWKGKARKTYFEFIYLETDQNLSLMEKNKRPFLLVSCRFIVPSLCYILPQSTSYLYQTKLSLHDNVRTLRKLKKKDFFVLAGNFPCCSAHFYFWYRVFYYTCPSSSICHPKRFKIFCNCVETTLLYIGSHVNQRVQPKCIYLSFLLLNSQIPIGARKLLYRLCDCCLNAVAFALMYPFL